MAEDDKCAACGGTIRIHKHTLSKVLIRALRKVYGVAGGRFVHLENAGLSYSERCNFQKLRYWGLVEKGGDRQRTGYWRVTMTGAKFITGELTAPAAVWTFRAKVHKFESDKWINVEAAEAQPTREYQDYVRDMVPAATSGKQLGLFG